MSYPALAMRPVPPAIDCFVSGDGTVTMTGPSGAVASTTVERADEAVLSVSGGDTRLEVRCEIGQNAPSAQSYLVFKSVSKSGFEVTEVIVLYHVVNRPE